MKISLIPSFEVRASRDRDVIGTIQYNALAHPAILEGHLADELAVIIDLAKRCSVCQVAVQRPIGNQVHVNGWSAAVRLDPGRQQLLEVPVGQARHKKLTKLLPTRWEDRNSVRIPTVRLFPIKQ